MANTYTSLYYHVVFSTKNRARCIGQELEPRVWAYLGGVARKHGMTALQVGGYEDHVHALIMMPPSVAPSQAVQFLKGDSSRWLHEEFPALKGFTWQDGYSAFTVSKSNLSAVVRYIRNQREHHRKRTFQEEYLELLRRHGVEYDERYVWG
jgi:REP element-mobilizing transposase RayT